MKDEYDFSKGKRNPYADEVKVRTTIRLDKESVRVKRLSGYANSFKALSAQAAALAK